MLIYSLKMVYEDMVKRKDVEGINNLKYALAFTGADGLSVNPEEVD